MKEKNDRELEMFKRWYEKIHHKHKRQGRRRMNEWEEETGKIKWSWGRKREREKRYNGLKDETTTKVTIKISVHLLTYIYIFKTTKARNKKKERRAERERCFILNSVETITHKSRLMKRTKARREKNIISHIYKKKNYGFSRKWKCAARVQFACVCEIGMVS